MIANDQMGRDHLSVDHLTHDCHGDSKEVADNAN